MKTEDWVAYEREREGMSCVFAQGSIELVLPLAVDRIRPAAPRREADASSRGALATGSGDGDPGLEV